MVYSSFTCFAALPAELQNQIWEQACHNIGPRVVELQRISYADQNPAYVKCYGSTCPIPNVLHVCHQAREIALTRWKLSFGCAGRYLPLTFFDFAEDTLLMDGKPGCLRELHRYVSRNDTRCIQKLAFDAEKHMVHSSDTVFVARGHAMADFMQDYFPNVRELIFFTSSSRALDAYKSLLHPMYGYKPVIITLEPATPEPDRDIEGWMKWFPEQYMGQCGYGKNLMAPEWKYVRVLREIES